MEDDLCLIAKDPTFSAMKYLGIILDVRKFMYGYEKINVLSPGFDITFHIQLNMGISKRIIFF